MKYNVNDYAKPIMRLIASAMKIKGSDICPCGSGKKYKKCCDIKDQNSVIFTEKAFKKVLDYKKSQGGKITEIPQGLWNNFSKVSLSRLHCLHPNCDNNTISCHLIPENILKKSFGSDCLESKKQDSLGSQVFVKTGAGQAGTLPVFCEKHDNNLFKEIDELKIDFLNKKHLFLLALKAIAFSLRRVQYLSGIDFQTEIFRPILQLENLKNTPLSHHFELQIPKHTCDQYLRLKITNNVFRQAIKMLQKKKYDDFSYFYRNLNYKKSIFLSAFINPLYDLNNTRINDHKTPINMTINIFTKENKIHVLLACPPKSKKLYASLLKQLKKADQKTFINFLNKIIKSSTDKILLPLNFNFSQNFIDLDPVETKERC